MSESVRQTSLTTAEVVIGTCPDMCPEKERYMREDRRRLSWFELDHNTSEPGVSKFLFSLCLCFSAPYCVLVCVYFSGS